MHKIARKLGRDTLERSSPEWKKEWATEQRKCGGRLLMVFFKNRPSAQTACQPWPTSPTLLKLLTPQFQRDFHVPRYDPRIHLFYSPHHLYLPLALGTLSLLSHPAGRSIVWMILVRWRASECLFLVLHTTRKSPNPVHRRATLYPWQQHPRRAYTVISGRNEKRCHRAAGGAFNGNPKGNL